ncbi:zinc finger protein 143 isoform X3 [Motacilla alba alba]|uniref:zinc finger protein 143 isoform X3 n=1 Tax=Motacilla alba alba TaxID=1094192 RepID=UPI0018D54734|nr:zinc finger protein 143 isoform X3 [Motacilla alba alba]XP_041270996.1 zinc finger protein 143 isoform X5 [Onychostruthus taczanowskii]
MLLAQINRDSQGMTEFSGGGMEAQHVTLCLTEAVAVQGDPSDGDNLENMEGVSLQAVTLADGSTAYIQHNSKDGKLMDGQVIQLEDGSAAYVQHVPMPKSRESLRLEDGQAVQLEDGTTAFIHHTSKDSYDQSALQAVQLEDGTTAYIHHTVQMPQSDTILAIQADGTVAGLHTGDAAIDPDTISALEQYAAKVSIDGNDSVSSTGIIGENEQDKKMQIVLQGHGTRVTAKSQQTGEKAFRCDYDGCGKLYTTAHHLKVHERSHTGDRPYQCEHPGCGKAFATGYGLKSHVRTHTGEKPYRCTEENCTKSFKTSGDLQKHIRTHTGEKPYVCTVPGCDKRFTEYSSLYKHHVVHTHSKPYNCNHCGKTYKQISTLAMHKRTAHNDTEPIEEEQEAFFEPPPGQGEDVLKGSQITYVTGVEGEDVISAQVATVTQSGLGQQVALISQDGTQHVNISQADMQAIGNTITMVTQDGTTITVPAHDAVISSAGTHSVAMVTAEGTEGQQVAIVAQDLAAFHSASSEMGHQQHGHHLVTTETRPVTLLATSNGTQIAVQLGEQQSLEEAIRIASRIQQGETPGIDD